MTAKRTQHPKNRRPHQRKPTQKGIKSRRGCPELYDELKQPTTLGLTKTAIRGLDELSTQLHISRSELVERIGRKLLFITMDESVALTQEVEP